MTALRAERIGRIPLHPAYRIEHYWLFGVMAEKDFATRQKISRPTAIKQFRLRVANYGPATAVGFGPQSEIHRRDQTGHAGARLHIFVTERRDTESIITEPHFLETEVTGDVAPRLPKQPEIGCEQRDSCGSNGIAVRGVGELPGHLRSPNAQAHGQSCHRRQHTRGSHVSILAFS